jgi:hypothetical protein
LPRQGSHWRARDGFEPTDEIVLANPAKFDETELAIYEMPANGA